MLVSSLEYLRRLLDGYIVESRTLGGASRFDHRFIPEIRRKTTFEEDNKRLDQPKAFSIETVYLCAFVLTELSGVKISMVATKNLIPIST